MKQVLNKSKFADLDRNMAELCDGLLPQAGLTSTFTEKATLPYGGNFVYSPTPKF